MCCSLIPDQVLSELPLCASGANIGSKTANSWMLEDNKTNDCESKTLAGLMSRGLTLCKKSSSEQLVYRLHEVCAVHQVRCYDCSDGVLEIEQAYLGKFLVHLSAV